MMYKQNVWKIMLVPLMVAVCLSVQPLRHVHAQELSIYDEGLSQYSLSRFGRAGKEWNALADRLERLGARNNAQLKRAAFANVLATIAYEKDNDNRAYDSWSQAIRLYLQTETKWDEQRSLIAQRIASFGNDVKSYTGENVPNASLRPDDYILLKMNDLMNLGNYAGPRAGLASTKNQSDVKSPEFERPSLFGDGNATVEAYQPSKVGSRRGLRDPSILLNQRAALRQARRSSREVASSPQAREAERRYRPSSGENNSLFNADPNKNIYEDIPQAAGLKTIEPYSGGDRELDEKQDSTSFSPEYSRIARVAWRYIENNHNPKTGLVNGLHDQAIVTTGDIGSSLMSYMAGLNLEIIDRFQFKNKVDTLLSSLEFMDLYKGELPNRLYNSTNMDILSLDGMPNQNGAGWDSKGMAKLLVSLKTLITLYPDYRQKVTKLVDGWNLSLLVSPKGIVDVVNIRGKEVDLDTARLGDEQYAAHALSFWGVLAQGAADYDDVKKVMVNNVHIPADTREDALLILDPFVLGEMEFGGRDKGFREALGRLYSVHVRQWQESRKVAISGRLTTPEVGEQLSYAIYHNEKPWQIVNPNGSSMKDGSGAWVSVKNAFAMSILYPGAFGDAVFNQAQLAQSSLGGFFTGLDNENQIVKNLDLETNATILESLLYMQRDFEPFIPTLGTNTAGTVLGGNSDRL